VNFGPGWGCAPCKTKLRPRKNEIIVEETFEDGRPYRVWAADLWECPDCGHQLILGYGKEPLAEHFEDNFETEHARVTHTLNGKVKALS